jgi:hypothetical protein
MGDGEVEKFNFSEKLNFWASERQSLEQLYLSLLARQVAVLCTIVGFDGGAVLDTIS